MNKTKKVLVIVFTIMLSISMIQLTNVSAATKVKLNKTKVTVYVGKIVTLKLKNNNKKAKWISSNKKIATVNNKGKVKGKKAGKATITAKVGRKKYKCKITVKAKKKVVNKSNNNNNNTKYIASSVKEKIANACMTYGKYDSNSDGEYYYLDKIEYGSNTTYYTQIQYFSTFDTVRIALLTSTGTLVYYDIQNVDSTTCSVNFYDNEYNYYGNGTLYKLLLDQPSAVVFKTSNMDYSLEVLAEKLTTSTAKLSLLYFDDIMEQYSVGVTYKDLGFDF